MSVIPIGWIPQFRKNLRRTGVETEVERIIIDALTSAFRVDPVRCRSMKISTCSIGWRHVYGALYFSEHHGAPVQDVLSEAFHQGPSRRPLLEPEDPEVYTARMLARIDRMRKDKARGGARAEGFRFIEWDPLQRRHVVREV